MTEYLTIEEIAARLRYKPEYVRDTLTKLPRFPKPCEPGGQKSRRWPWADVVAFMESTRAAA